MNNDYWYDNYRLAEFYDDIYIYDDDYKLWSEYIKEGDNILEIASGTGRLTKLILENNKRISLDAVDYSQEMLDILEQKINGWNIDKTNRIKLINDDMRYFISSNKYDVIIISANSLNHIEKNDDFEITLSNMYELLKVGGILLFDILNPRFEYLIRDPEKDYDGEIYIQSKTKRYFHVSEKSYYDISSQINHVMYRYFYCDKHGIKEDDSPEYRMNVKVRLYFPQEADYYISKSKFNNFKKYGWYDRRSFDGSTPEQIYVLQRES